MSFPKFRDYVDSGTAWLGLLPAHWRVDRLKRSITSCRNGIWGNDVAGDGNDLPCVRVADFDRTRLIVDLDQPTLRNVTPKEQEGRILKKNNLLLEKSGGGELQPVGCVVLYQDEASAVCSNFVAKVELAPGMYPSFWRYVHAAAYAVRLNTRSIKQNTGIQNLDHQQYFDERAPFPPFSEQEAIASFLDQETSKIDALISEQQRLIELLKEKRQSVISHAVTKGLNPDVRMKPSGVEWLGEVPEHWELAGLTKYLESLVDYRGRTPTKVEDGILLLTARNIKDGYIDYDASEEFISEDDYPDVMRRGLPAIGDVIFTTEAPLGQVANVNRTDIALAQRVVKFRGRSKILDNYFLKYWILGALCQATLVKLATGSTALGIKGSKIGQVPLLVPPYIEQEAIVNYLDREVARIHSLSLESEQAIRLLHERRTALISAAVTGKIDVRNYAATQKDAA